MRRNALTASCLAMLFQHDAAERATGEAKKLYLTSGAELRCVWSNQLIQENSLDVDHLIPFSEWPQNSLWNLLPSCRKVNNEKSNRVPARAQLEFARERTYASWRLSAAKRQDDFYAQLQEDLGVSSAAGWESRTFDEVSDRLSLLGIQRGLSEWTWSGLSRNGKGSQNQRRSPDKKC